MQVYDKQSGQFVEDPNFKPIGTPPTAPPSSPPTGSPTAPPPGTSDTTGSPPTMSGPQMQFQQAWNNAPDLKTKNTISTTWKDANGYNLFGSAPAGAGSKLTAAQQSRHDNIQSALASLDSTEVNLQQGGGAKGIMGWAGKIPLVGQYLDPTAASYHDTMIEPATSLAKAITNSSRAPESVVNKYMSSLPQISDNPEFAHAKMNKMRLELLKQAQTFKYNDITSQYDPKTGSPVQTLQGAGVLPGGKPPLSSFER